ncbi:hypothetical protein A4X09_0g4796 [Tilletia walkeri]|uniref:F-box domain-containing protein n=1 Tax=Tilletia walkeri TaxID=117179 RepID=A0A8X7N7Q6_9BASI|nr:hypothetical protein A4X09_0g4796 [Tilletia walkeri]
MSTSLLLTAITNRLAAGTLNNGTQQQEQDGTTESSEQQLTEWVNISHVSDDELVDVISLPGTAPGTPRNISRPSSPSNGNRTETSPSKSSSRSRVAAVGGSAVKTKSKTDPLRSLPAEVSQRIFLQLSIPTLISCSAVSKRWRRSATLNFCWFKYSQAFDPVENVDFFLSIPPPASSQPSSSSKNTTDLITGNNSSPSKKASSSSGPSAAAPAAMWTRRESRTDWKLTFAKQVRMARRDLERPDIFGGASGGSGYSTPSRTERLAAEGVLTNTERRQQQWSGEAVSSQAGYSKNEMRGHYKSQGSRGGKVKGKSGKGGTRAGHDSLWE